MFVDAIDLDVAGLPQLAVHKPDAYRWPRIAFTGPVATLANKRGLATVGEFAEASIGPRLDANRPQGNTVGPSPGEWKLSNVSEGFTLWPVDDIDTDEIQVVTHSPDDVIYITTLDDIGGTDRLAQVDVSIVVEETGEPLPTNRMHAARMKHVHSDHTFPAGTEGAMRYVARWNGYEILWLKCDEDA